MSTVTCRAATETPLGYTRICDKAKHHDGPHVSNGTSLPTDREYWPHTWPQQPYHVAPSTTTSTYPLTPPDAYRLKAENDRLQHENARLRDLLDRVEPRALVAAFLLDVGTEEAAEPRPHAAGEARS